MTPFDKRISQIGTMDEKHDQLLEFFPCDDLLAMWVAEMDFQTAPAIHDALLQRVEHGIYGYSYRDDVYYKAIINWYQSRHNVFITKKMMSFDTGVLKAIFEMIRMFTNQQDTILITTPIYAQFANVVHLSKRNLNCFPLENINNRYVIDFIKLKEALKHCRMMILCSPHNPGGQIWTKEELIELVHLCEECNTILISDEIHGDLTMRQERFTSLLQVSNKAIVMNSPSKAFNLAGLQHSYTICNDDCLQARIREHYERHKIKSTNVLSMIALRAAYCDGETWLQELCDYIYGNYEWILSFIKAHKLKLEVFNLQSSYLLWIDFSYYFKEASELEDFLVHTCKIATTFGRYFDESSGCFTRLNIGTQRIQCEEAMNRIKKGLLERGKL